MNKNYDLIVVGAGPSGVFTAYELIELGLNKDKYLGVEETKKLMFYTDEIYLKFGADPKVEGLDHVDKINEIARKAKENGLTLANCPIRHLGTEKSHELYKRIQDYLLQNNIEILFETNVKDLIVENECVKGVVISPSGSTDENDETTLFADKVVLGIGRKGAEWLADMCSKHNINNRAGVVDIGVRYELPDSVMEDVNKYLYEGKFVGYLPPYKDKVRTFCQNPSGFVANEVYDNNLTLVNGHSYKNKKSTNTNLALLASHHFSDPFKEPIKYGINIAENANQLGNGNVLVQRLGDILNGKRTWEKDLATNSVVPTLKTAIAGDITFAIGYRTMVDILEFIKAMDKVVPGFAHPDNLLYAAEVKFYSNQILIDNNFETNIKGLYSIGDGGGLTRGLIMASASGVQMARILRDKI